jgi:hypothetical protein
VAVVVAQVHTEDNEKRTATIQRVIESP